MYVFVPDNNRGDFQQANFGCFDRSFDYRLIVPEGKFRSSRVGDRVSERSNNGDIVVLSFILYRNIKFVQIIIRNNIVTIMDDNLYIYICVDRYISISNLHATRMRRT